MNFISSTVKIAGFQKHKFISNCMQSANEPSLQRNVVASPNISLQQRPQTQRGGSVKSRVIINVCNVIYSGPGQLSRYSDSLRAGQSGDRIPVRGDILPPVQNHSASLAMGTGSFQWVKWPTSDVDHPPLFRAEVKGRAGL